MRKIPTDEEFLGRLKEKAPEVLEADIDFDSITQRVIQPQKQGGGKALRSAKSKRKLPKPRPARQRAAGQGQ